MPQPPDAFRCGGFYLIFFFSDWSCSKWTLPPNLSFYLNPPPLQVAALQAEMLLARQQEGDLQAQVAALQAELVGKRQEKVGRQAGRQAGRRGGEGARGGWGCCK